MWKRTDAERPPTRSERGTAPSESPSPPPARAAAPGRPTEAINIGPSVAIKGELSGSEDLTIDGQVEGTIELREHTLTVGPNGKIKAQVFAKAVVVEGHVLGNISAGDRVDIRDRGTLEGDIVAPRVGIAEGALFRGSIDMQRTAPSATRPPAASPPKVTPRPSSDGPSRPATQDRPSTPPRPRA